MKLARLLLRVLIGGLFIGHGTQKLFGWFGGGGLKDTAEMFDAIGMKPGHVNATAAGVAETAGGAGILLGYKTPFSASALIAVMLTAINRVHLKNGPWATNGGYEYNAVLIAGAASLAEMGPGRLSLDGKNARSGPLWGLASLVLGVVGAAGAHVFTEAQSGGVLDEPPITTETPAEADSPGSTATEAPADNGTPDVETPAGSSDQETVIVEIQTETHTAGGTETTE